jgi:hypothetical protein
MGAEPESAGEQSGLDGSVPAMRCSSAPRRKCCRRKPETPEESSQDAEQSPVPMETDQPDAQPAAEEEPVEDAAAEEVTEEQAEPVAEPEAEVQYRPLGRGGRRDPTQHRTPRGSRCDDRSHEEARREIEAYFRARSGPKPCGRQTRCAQPAPLDLEALGQKYQLVPGETGLVDALEIETTNWAEPTGSASLKAKCKRSRSPKSLTGRHPVVPAGSNPVVRSGCGVLVLESGGRRGVCSDARTGTRRSDRCLETRSGTGIDKGRSPTACPSGAAGRSRYARRSGKRLPSGCLRRVRSVG